jgi:hypothetical protein
MDIVQISNVFNSLAQIPGIGLKFYHAGLASKINQNGISNNFDSGNSTGKIYPLLLFPYDAIQENANFSNSRQLARTRMTLLFYDTMFYGSDSKNDTRTEVEIARDLDKVATNFLAAIRAANGREIAGNPCNGFGIEGDVTRDWVPFAHNGRLMCLRCDFTLTYFVNCETYKVTDADFDALTPPNGVPVVDYDLEDPNHP